VPSGRKAAIFISLSLSDVSLLIYSPTTTYRLFISHTGWLITAIYTLLLLRNSMTMAPPLFNLQSTNRLAVYACSSGLLSPLCTQNRPSFLALLSAPCLKFTTR
jgi:hypothetical protein